MTTKREADLIEQIVGSMNENEYWGLVGWLSNGTDRPLWDCMPRSVMRKRKWKQEVLMQGGGAA